MKRITIALLAAGAALAANSARAHTNVSIGVDLGSPAYFPPPAVVYAPPAVVYGPGPVRGYWKDVTVKTWVPGRWVMSRDGWGRPVRACEPGYYAYRTDRVWVDARHDRGNHYGYENRGYGYENRGY